jgi:hypothetical protein
MLEQRQFFIAVLRELAELTGETPSQLYEWWQSEMKRLSAPDRRPKAIDAVKVAELKKLAGARQTFYNRLQGQGWRMKSVPSQTRECRLESYPMSCELRLRAVSWVGQFAQDKTYNRQRQMVLLLGYEKCSQFLHFWIFRGAKSALGENEVPTAGYIPENIVAAFTEEFVEMLGLPVERVLLTQRLSRTPTMEPNTVLCLSLGKRGFLLRAKAEVCKGDELICRFAIENGNDLKNFKSFPEERLFDLFCQRTSANKLTQQLSKLVNRHNRNGVVSRLETARKRLDELKLQSLQNNPVDSRKKWISKRQRSAFHLRIGRIGYLANALPLHNISYCRRYYRDFEAVMRGPRGGSHAGDLGDMATWPVYPGEL